MTGRAADFWSRRKAAVAAEEARLARAAEAARPAETADAPDDARPDAEILAELDLPHPDELGPGDDFRAYLGKAVPQRIRRLALRRLWTLNPALANLDGLLEYGEDYTDTATVVENLQTAFDLTRGVLSAALEEPEGAEEGPVEATTEAEPESAGEGPDPVQEAASPSVAAADVPAAAVAPDEAPDGTRGARPPRRRMSFDFPDAEHAASDERAAQA